MDEIPLSLVFGFRGTKEKSNGLGAPSTMGLVNLEGNENFPMFRDFIRSPKSVTSHYEEVLGL